jgi:hypothetical protein
MASNWGLSLRTAQAMTPPRNTAARGWDGGEDLLPEAGLVLVHDDEGQQARIDHLHQIFILQHLRGRLDVDEGSPAALRAWL